MELFVTTILDLYENLQLARRILPEASEISEDQVRFCGFDANKESNWFQSVKKVYDSGRYQTVLSNSSLNSDSPMLVSYQRMLFEYALIKTKKNQLSKDELARILDAQSHPDNRK